MENCKRRNRHSRFACFPAFLTGCAWDGLCVGWGGQTGRVSGGWSDRRRGWELAGHGLRTTDWFRVVLSLCFCFYWLWKRMTARKMNAEKEHFSEMHTCQCDTHTHSSGRQPFIVRWKKWFHILLKAIVSKMVKPLNSLSLILRSLNLDLD